MALRTLTRFTYRHIRRARAWFLRLLEVLRSEHILIYQKKPIRTLDIRSISKQNKGTTLHSWGRRIIPESLVPDVQAVLEENVNIQTHAISIVVRYNYGKTG